MIGGPCGVMPRGSPWCLGVVWWIVVNERRRVEGLPLWRVIIGSQYKVPEQDGATNHPWQVAGDEAPWGADLSKRGARLIGARHRDENAGATATSCTGSRGG